ncbi:jacalin-like lectin [Labilithrix luteola]|uniref:jacalin-like lectin n=1 Tax=Labilithrix luteola TaxID=1391654 RepID=UPI0011BA6CBF|nr:hypothetical protein [Labilithrix luteola]
MHRVWMDDDAFINLRVVRNVLEGNGLVYNAGERVEATTSPLWVAILCLSGALPLKLEYVAAYGGIAMSVMGLLAAQMGAFSGTREERLHVPLGAMVFAVIPAAWDYASSGLETGLSFCWLGLSFWTLVCQGRSSQWSPTKALGASALLGLGPLVRPELALYSASMLIPLVVHGMVQAGPSRRARLRAAGMMAIAAVALPLGYELFRMGYYAALVPNTAIAKQAFAFNTKQGFCYAKNFFSLYRLPIALSVLAVFWGLQVRRFGASGEHILAAIFIALPVLATLHVGYVVAMGGDYMHGRMFLPALFAGLMPVSLVAFPRKSELREYLVAIGLTVPLAGWAFVCGTKLRVDKENVCGIGDERGWYARMAGAKNPILLGDYRNFQFHKTGTTMRAEVERDCPIERRVDEGSCRRTIHFDHDTEVRFHPPRRSLELSRDVAPGMRGVVTENAIGIVGQILPSTVHLLDRHGLADAFASRLAVAERGRPGHEKDLPAAWVAARFAAREPTEDSAIVAARHALQCGSLAALDRAIHEPLNAGRFFDNMRFALASRAMKISPDPFEAEAQYCGTPRPPVLVAGGKGGEPYRWQCPAGSELAALSGTVHGEESVSSITPVCVANDGHARRASGPEFGQHASSTFESSCAPDEHVVGVHGSRTHLVHEVGLLCASNEDGRTTRRAASGGIGGGTSFELRCPESLVAIGVTGRAGDRIDAVGIVCGPAQ